MDNKRRCTDRDDDDDDRVLKESDKLKCWPNDTVFITWPDGGSSVSTLFG